jgi:PAS domain S-box-containing protein
MGCRLRLRLTWVALLAWITAAGPVYSKTRQVVLFYDERTDLPGLSVLDAGFVRTLTSESPVTVEIYREEMNLSRFDSVTYLPLLRDYLRAKYASKKIDVAVAVMSPALDFLLKFGDVILPGTPIVFLGIDKRELGSRPLPPHVTGILVKREFAPTLELALTLHPDTKRVVVVAGTSEFDTQLVELAKAEFRAYEDRVTVSYLTALPLRELLTELSRLPPHTIVLYTTLFRDGAGEPFVPHDVAERITAAANAPVYGFVDQYLGRGIVGGRLYSMNRHGEEAARLVLQVLSGANPANLPLVEPDASATVFDWRQLQRWGISQSRLPPEAIIRFLEPSFWSQYKLYVIGVLGIVALQGLLIARLLAQRSRLRQAEIELRQSEARFRTTADIAPVMIWMSGPDKQSIWSNKRLLDFVGRTMDEASGFGWRQDIHPDDLERCTGIYSTSFDARRPFSKEFRIRRHDGDYRWVLDSGIPWYGARNEFLGYIGSCIDITTLKEAESEVLQHRVELAHVTRVSTMGELTASLAHELNQPLTAIRSNAEAARRFLESDPADLGEVKECLRDIARDDRRASEVIARLRAMAKKQEPTFVALDVCSVIRDVVSLAHSDTESRHISVVVNCREGLPRIRGDRVELQQVLLNLLFNSFAAMKELPAAERRVAILAWLDDEGTVRIAVRDQGTGIAEDQIKKIFQPFFTTKKEGLGMGLSVSRTIIQSHGGRLWAQNNPERGATFLLTVPVASEGQFDPHSPRAREAGITIAEH